MPSLIEKVVRAASDSSAVLYRPSPKADARIAYGPDQFDFGDLRLPNATGPHPVVVVIHGGFWRSMFGLEHIGHLCAALTSAGVATWSIEYRRLGNPGGGWPGTFLDVARAVNHVRELAQQYPLDLDRVVASGHSAGGHLALWVAALHRIPPGNPLHVPDPLPLRAAISLAGVSDLRLAWELGLSNQVVQQFMGGSPDEYPERYAVASPYELAPLGVRQFLLHGRRDEDVPFEISERYHAEASARGDEVTLIPLPDIGHFELIDPQSRAWPKVLEAVKDLAGL